MGLVRPDQPTTTGIGALRSKPPRRQPTPRNRRGDSCRTQTQSRILRPLPARIAAVAGCHPRSHRFSLPPLPPHSSAFVRPLDVLGLDHDPVRMRRPPLLTSESVGARDPRPPLDRQRCADVGVAALLGIGCSPRMMDCCTRLPARQTLLSPTIGGLGAPMVSPFAPQLSVCRSLRRRRQTRTADPFP